MSYKILKFNESADQINLIEDFLLEYLDKWNLSDYENRGDKTRYNGYYSIQKASSKYFKLDGFADGKSGYLVIITFTGYSIYKEAKENEWKSDMMLFINRVCSTGYEYDTKFEETSNGYITYYISFFK